MDLIALAILVIGLWLFSPIVLLIALISARRQIRWLREQQASLIGSQSAGLAPISSLEGEITNPAPSAAMLETPVAVDGKPSPRHAAIDLENLLLLQLELTRLRDSGELPPDRYHPLADELQHIWMTHLGAGGAAPDNELWRQRRALAWRMLTGMATQSLGLPPWSQSTPPTPTPPPVTATSPTVSLAKALPQAELPAVTVTPRPASRPPLPAVSPIPEPQVYSPAVTEEAVRADPDWRPAPPNPLENVLQTLSGWPKLIAPFLAQNVGWFIGGFCFIAGALFLIANTSGFINAFIVFACLFGASAFLLWAGYQFRRQRPELSVASSMLLTLSMLLAPLVLGVASHLIRASNGEPLLLIISLLATAVTVAAFTGAAYLSSALMDRALQGRYPLLLTALASVQLASPLAGFAPDWRVLLGVHIVLLALLGYGLWTFAAEWLRRLFVDQQRTTYYAAGLLLYTAAVSFVHLTWLWPQPLPVGYFGPFLMALSLLLFPVDVAFKEWVHKYTLLSRFTFVLYALSAVAVAVAFRSTLALLLTLACGAVLYGGMAWRYRTLPPLYLLFGCLASLYGVGLVHWLPPAWHGLAGQPGLFGLLLLGRWTGERWRRIARQCFSVFAVLLAGLTAWSLSWNVPGSLGFATAATAAGLAYLGLRWALALAEPDSCWGYAGYGVTALASVAVAYLPRSLGIDWIIQTAYGQLALAALWAFLGLRDVQLSAVSRRVWVTSALANVALALASLPLWPAVIGRLEPVLLLGLAGLLLLGLSLRLRWQALFYGVMACAAGAGMLIKRSYFPGPTIGLVEFGFVAGLWLLLWQLARHSRLRCALLVDETDWMQAEAQSLEALIRRPLEQAMLLLWGVGLVRLSLALLAELVSVKWSLAAGLGVATSLLLVGYFHRFRWIALPFVLGLVGLLASLFELGLPLSWLGAAAVLYALIVWRLSRAILAHPMTERLVRVLGFTVVGGSGGRGQVEAILYSSAFGVAVWPVLASPLLVGVWGWPAASFLPALTGSLLLFLLAGWHYRTARYAYAALMTVTVIAWLMDSDGTSSTLFVLGQPLVNVLLSGGLALIRLGLENDKAAPLAYWRWPLRAWSTLLYGLALIGALLGGWADDLRLPLLLALLAIALVPVMRGWPHAARWRGVGLALLCSALAWNLAGWADFAWLTQVWLIIGWGYALWLDGNLLLSRWNRRQPDWAIDPTSWTVLGLVSVLFGAALGYATAALSAAMALAASAPYLFLLLRNTAWPGMAWLALAVVTASGLAAVVDFDGWNSAFDSDNRALIINQWLIVLLWFNGLLALVPGWRRYGQTVAGWLKWQQHDLAEPLFWLSFAALLLILGQFGWLTFWQPGNPELTTAIPWAWIGMASLLVVTAVHAFSLRQQALQAHGVLLALSLLLGALSLKLTLSTGWLPFALAVGNGALLLAWRYAPSGAEGWRTTLAQWLNALPVVILVLLYLGTGFVWEIVMATCSLLAVVMVAQGWQHGGGIKLQLGLGLALVTSYLAWLGEAPGFAYRSWVGLTPWFALQTVLLLLAVIAVQHRLAAWLRLTPSPADTRLMVRISAVERTLRRTLPSLVALGILWLIVHSYTVLAYQQGWGASPWHFGAIPDALAASTALLLLVGWQGVQAWRQLERPSRVYGVALLLGWLAGYVRLVTLGLAPFTIAETAVLIVAAYLAGLLYRLTAVWPFHRLALLLPLLALLTVPWQLASAWAGGTLLAAAVLYLSLATLLHNPVPFYLGVLALNGAVYLWAPLWAARYGLWQFYIIPAAVSVLALVHLHRRELRPGVLSAVRLAALSALYAGAGLDVFLRSELWVFVLALGLALAGVVLGIALRVRAFLYAGIAFLLLNVSGQLIRFYPDQGLSRALILLGLGTLITVGMVLFSLKREEILQRVRIVRADLAAWE